MDMRTRSSLSAWAALGLGDVRLGEAEAEAKAEGALAGFDFFLAILGRGGFSSSSSSVLESRLRRGKSESESSGVEVKESTVAAALLCGGARDVFTMVRARLGLG